MQQQWEVQPSILGGEGLFISDRAADVALTAKGAAGQTGNIWEVQNSAGTVLVAVDPNGLLAIGSDVKLKRSAANTLRLRNFADSGDQNFFAGIITATGNLIGRENQATQFKVDATGLGAFQTAPVAKQAVAGSRVGGAALVNFLTAMANYGLITDNTTA